MGLLLVLHLLCLLSTGYGEAEVGWSARLRDPLDNVPEDTEVLCSEVSSNSGNWYNGVTGRFAVPEDKLGLYYISLTIGIPPTGLASNAIYSTTGGRTFVGLQFNNPFTNGTEFSSRGYMRLVPQPTTFMLMTESNSTLLGRPYYTTSWTMFRYGDITSYSVAFSVARSDDYFGISESIPWQLSNVNIDGGGEPPFNLTSGQFTVPIDGIYFFVISAGSVAQQSLQPFLHYWPGGEPPSQPLCSLNRTVRSSLGMDTTGRAFLTQLNEGDVVAMGNGFGSNLRSSDESLETSFSGFGYALYEPDADDVVAFCAFMTEWEWSGVVSSTIENWHGTTVNKAYNGAPFNTTSGIFEVPVDGTYFVSFSVAVVTGKNAIVSLTDHVGYEIARIDRRNKLLDGTDTMSRDVVVDLAVGMNLRLQVGSSFSLQSSNNGKEVCFLGMRLRDHL